MGTVLLLMGAGMVAGFFLSGRHHLLKGVDYLTTWAIYLLLFFLGISVGLNDTIIKNLETIGLQALLLTVGAVGGSVLVAWGLYRWIYKKSN